MKMECFLEKFYNNIKQAWSFIRELIVLFVENQNCMNKIDFNCSAELLKSERQGRAFGEKGRKPRVRPHIFPNCEEDWEYSEWVGRKEPRGGRLAFEGSASSLAVHWFGPNIKNPTKN